VIATMDKPLKEYLTLPEASKIVGMTEQYVLRLCENGKIQGAVKFGKIWAIPRSSIRRPHPHITPPPKPNPQYLRELNKLIKEAITHAKQQDEGNLNTSEKNVYSTDDNYEPHDYLKRAIFAMSAYCVSDEQVNIANSETGAIAAIMLYIINAEPKVSRTKLECYLILLDRLVKEDTGKELFTWTLNKYRRISNFKFVFKHMIECGILSENGSARFFVSSKAWKIIQGLPIMLDDILPYLDKLLARYDDYTAGEMLKEIK